MPMATREAQREYQRIWIAKRRDEWITANGPCVECGSWDELEVDHKDRSLKEINPRGLWSMARDNPKRIRELAKCQVLCHKCHIEKTWTIDFQRAQHGSEALYNHHGCRCDLCRKAHAIATAEKRARKRASVVESTYTAVLEAAV